MRRKASARIGVEWRLRWARQKQQPLEHRLLLTATFCLLAGGAVMVYSASSARTLLQGQGDGTSYLVKYVAYGAVGLVGMYLVSRLNLEHVRRYTRALLIARFVMLRAGQGARASACGSTARSAGSASARCSSSRARS